MPLTKTDISQIKEVVDASFKISEVRVEKKIDGKINELARAVAKGFEGIDKRLDVHDKRLEHLELNTDHMSATIGIMQVDIAEIKKHFVYRYEFEDLMARVKYLETKLGVESGK